ncbi:MAG: hypothetical protein N2438_11100 [Limisphaera sp.]|nr:hypothetical protein [Limisphaera sp.]
MVGLWIFAMAVGWAGSFSDAAEVQFQAEGVVTMHLVGSVFEDTGEPSRSAHFTVAVSNECWFIRCRFRHSDYPEYGSDGASVVVTVGMPRLPSDGRRPPLQLFSVHPAHDRWGFDPWTHAVWFAWASGHYFKDRGLRDLIPPFGAAGSDPAAYAYEAEGVLTNDAYPLPVRMAFRVSEERLRNAPFHPELFCQRPEQRHRPLDFLRPGALGGEYRASDWAQIHGLWIPRRFELLVYREWDQASQASGSPALKGRVEGVITNLVERVVHVGPPRMEGVARVVDYRLAEGRPGVAHGEYYVTNGVWPSLEEAARRARFYTWRGGHGGVSFDAGSLPPEVSRSRRAVLLGIFCALALVPLGVWVSRTWQRATRKSQDRLSS